LTEIAEIQYKRVSTHFPSLYTHFQYTLSFLVTLAPSQTANQHSSPVLMAKYAITEPEGRYNQAGPEDGSKTGPLVKYPR